MASLGLVHIVDPTDKDRFVMLDVTGQQSENLRSNIDLYDEACKYLRKALGTLSQSESKKRAALLV